MEGFEISKIKLKNSKEPSVEEKLTGSVITNLKDDSVEPNVELEGKEYLRFPDGHITRAEGEAHEKSGIKMNLPDGTTILSNSMTIPSSDLKKLNKEYDLNLKGKVTYAEAQEKYRQKIGLKKLDKEQEEAISSLKKEMEKKDTDENTKKINEEFLQEEIGSIEKLKAALQPKYDGFFQEVFGLQESKKKPKNKTGEYKFGGSTRSNLDKVLEKYGLTEEELLGGQDVPAYNYGGTIDTYEGGGEVEALRKKIKNGEITGASAQRELNTLKAKGLDVSDLESQVEYLLETSPRIRAERDRVEGVEKIGYQSANETGYGTVTKDNIEDVIYSLYRNFPDYAEEQLGVKFDEDGEMTYNKKAYNTAIEEIGKLQSSINTRAKDNLDYMKSRPDIYTDAEIEAVEDYLTNQTFTGEEGKEVDDLLGGYTASRYNLGLSLVNEEELQKLEDNNIFTARQLEAKLEEDPEFISPESSERLTNYMQDAPDNVDFRIDALKASPAQVFDEVGGKAPKGEDTFETTEIEDDIVTATKRRFPRAFAHLDMTPLPPSPMEAHLKGQTNLQRIDPVRVGTQNVEQQMANQMGTVMTQIESLPPAQKAAAMATLQTSTNQALNQSITQANQINAQNQSSAELFNIGQSAQEQQANLQNALSYERRQMLAKSNTQEDTRRYYDRLQSIALNEMQNNQKLNMLDQMASNYSLSPDGSLINFDPSSKYVSDRGMRALQRQYSTQQNKG